MKQLSEGNRIEGYFVNASSVFVSKNELCFLSERLKEKGYSLRMRSCYRITLEGVLDCEISRCSSYVQRVFYKLQGFCLALACMGFCPRVNSQGIVEF